MTELEKNQKLSYEETKKRILTNYKNVSFFSHKGYDIIIYCKQGKGVNMKFFLNGFLVRIRNYGFVKDIKHRATAYVEEVLLKGK